MKEYKCRAPDCDRVFRSDNGKRHHEKTKHANHKIKTAACAMPAHVHLNPRASK